MKKAKEFLKALVAYLMIALLLVCGVIGVIGELFPTRIPDGLWTVCGIVCIPFWILFFVTILKERHAQHKTKKGKKPSPGGKVAEQSEVG